MLHLFGTGSDNLIRIYVTLGNVWEIFIRGSGARAVGRIWSLAFYFVFVLRCRVKNVPSTSRNEAATGFQTALCLSGRSSDVSRRGGGHESLPLSHTSQKMCETSLDAA